MFVQPVRSFHQHLGIWKKYKNFIFFFKTSLFYSECFGSGIWRIRNTQVCVWRTHGTFICNAFDPFLSSSTVSLTHSPQIGCVYMNGSVRAPGFLVRTLTLSIIKGDFKIVILKCYTVTVCRQKTSILNLKVMVTHAKSQAFI